MPDQINNPAPSSNLSGPDPNAPILGDEPPTHEELMNISQSVPKDWSFLAEKTEEREPDAPVEEQPDGDGEETPEFDLSSLDEILSGLDVDPEYAPDTPDVLTDPEVAPVFEKIAQAAGFPSFAALQENIREKEVEAKISEVLNKRQQDLTEEGWDEETIERQLQLDKRELELQAKEAKYQKIEAEQRVASAYKKYPLADVQLLRDFALAAPAADVDAFAKRLHDRSRTIAERSVSKYVAQKAKDGTKPQPRNTPQAGAVGVSKPADTVSERSSWASILGLGR